MAWRWLGVGAAALLLALALPVGQSDSAVPAWGSWRYPLALAQDDLAGEKIERLQLVLRKLRATLQSMKAIEELEKQGLPRDQAKEIQQAAEAKVRQLTRDILFILKSM